MIFAKSELHHISNLLDWVDNSIKNEQKMKNKQQSFENTKNTESCNQLEKKYT